MGVVTSFRTILMVACIAESAGGDRDVDFKFKC
jgi:hypothetical protein